MLVVIMVVLDMLSHNLAPYAPTSARYAFGSRYGSGYGSVSAPAA